jgi:hypothetical protein
MTKYCEYQAERFKELASVFKKNTPLDKLMQCVAVTGHKTIQGSHIFGPKVAQLVITFDEIRSLLPCFQKLLSLSLATFIHSLYIYLAPDILDKF